MQLVTPVAALYVFAGQLGQSATLAAPVPLP